MMTLLVTPPIKNYSRKIWLALQKADLGNEEALACEMFVYGKKAKKSKPLLLKRGRSLSSVLTTQD